MPHSHTCSKFTSITVFHNLLNYHILVATVSAMAVQTLGKALTLTCETTSGYTDTITYSWAKGLEYNSQNEVAYFFLAVIFVATIIDIVHFS